MATAQRPDWSRERRLTRSGFMRIAGLDEAGRGCLAGPVVAAAVILRPGAAVPGLNDSKLLTAGQRERVLRLILRNAVAWSLGAADAEEIDRVNILNATRTAMRRAVEALPAAPDHLLVDALSLPEVPLPQMGVVGGDRLSVSIAAASIVAKVSRDRLMLYYHRRYPQWGFASHKGYGTAAHMDAVLRLGPAPIHRLTFRGVVPSCPGEA